MIKKVTFKTGLLFSLLGFSVFVINIIDNYKNHGLLLFKGDFNLILLIVSLIFLLTSFVSFAKYVHIICLWVTTLLTFYDNPEQGSAIVQIVLILIISYKYGSLTNQFIKKCIVGFCFVLVVISFSFHSRKQSILAFMPLVFLFAVFMISAFIIFTDEVKAYLKKVKEYKDQIKILKTNLQDTHDYLRFIGEGYIDPLKAGLTNAELILLRTLCVYKESNEGLSIRLKKSKHTVKNQMSRIMVKIGSESRHQLVDLCKNYFLDGGVTPPSCMVEISI